MTIEWFECHNGQWEDICCLTYTFSNTSFFNFVHAQFCKNGFLFLLAMAFVELSSNFPKKNLYFCNSWSREIFLVLMTLPMETSWSLLGPGIEVGLTPNFMKGSHIFPLSIVGSFFSFFYQVNWMCNAWS